MSFPTVKSYVLERNAESTFLISETLKDCSFLKFLEFIQLILLILALFIYTALRQRL